MSMFTLKNNVYDVLKYIAQIFLPGLGTLYFALSMIWHFPAAQEVIGSITAVDTFLGFLLQKSSKNYVPEGIGEPVGIWYVKQDVDGTPTGMRVMVDKEPFVVEDGKTVTFRVKREQDTA